MNCAQFGELISNLSLFLDPMLRSVAGLRLFRARAVWQTARDGSIQQRLASVAAFSWEATIQKERRKSCAWQTRRHS